MIRRQEDNTKIHLRAGCEDMIHLYEDKIHWWILVLALLNLWFILYQ